MIQPSDQPDGSEGWLSGLHRGFAGLAFTFIGFAIYLAVTLVFGLLPAGVPAGGRELTADMLDEASFNGFNLSEGWQFLPRDNPGWTPRGLPGGEWIPIPDMEEFDPEQALAGRDGEEEWDGIGWFRVQLTADSTLAGEKLALLYAHYGAVEFYLGNSLLHRDGIIAGDGSLAQGFTTRFPDPVMLPGTLLQPSAQFQMSSVARMGRPIPSLLRTGGPSDTLYVRIHSGEARELMPSLWMTLRRTSHPSGFLLSIARDEQAADLHADEKRNNTLLLIAGFTFLMLAVYHFYFHTLSPQLWVVFIYGIYASAAAAHSFFWYLFNQRTPFEYSLFFYTGRFVLFFLTVYVGSFLLFKLLRIANYRLVFGGLALNLLALALDVFTGLGTVWFSMSLFAVITGAGIVHGFVRRKPDAWFIALSFIGQVLAVCYWLLTFQLTEPGPLSMEAVWFMGAGVTFLVLGFVISTRIRMLSREKEEAYRRMVELTTQTQLLENQASAKEKARRELSSFNRELQRQLDARTQELVRAERQAAFGQFVQGIVHNLRNPLTSVAGSAELNALRVYKLLQHSERGELEAERLREELRELSNGLSSVQNGTTRLSDMITSLMSKSRADRSDEATRFDLNQMVRDEVEFLRSDEQLRKLVKVELDLPDEPQPVHLVRGELAQVIDNLVVNARDALYQSEDASIMLRVRPARHRVVLEIIDNGPGIPEDIRDRIFDPFFTTKPAARGNGSDEEDDDSDAPRGTGLGLWMVRQSVESMDGRIDLETEPGRGTTFRIELPAAPSAKA